MPRLSRCLLCLLLLLCAAPAWGATYFVATSGGNNTNSCNSATNSTTAKQTIGGVDGGWACATGAGDIVDVRSGTYAENLNTGNQTLVSGSAGVPKVLRAHAGETVTVRPTAGCNVVDFRGAESIHHWTIEGIVFDGRNLNCGGSTTNTLSLNGGSSDLTFTNVQILNTANPGGGTSVGVNGAASNLKFSHAYCSGTHKTFGDFQGSHCFYMAVPGDNNIIEYSTITSAGGYGIQYNDSAQVGAGGNTGGLIHHNLVVSNGCCSSSKGGIVLGVNIRTTQVYNNLVISNFAETGIDINGTNNMDNEIYNNTIYNHGSYCIAANIALRPLIKNNLCSGSGSGLGLFAGTSNAVVSNNLVFGVATVSNAGTGNTITGTVTGNPLFINAALQDFHLQTFSPAIGAGVTLTGVPTDYADSPRTVPYDIGAYRYGGGVGVAPGLQARWQLDDGTGTSAVDTTGNGHTGTFVATPVWAPGRVGPKSLLFDGTNQAVTVPTAAGLDLTTALTLTAWIKPTAIGGGGFGRILDKHGTGSTGYFFFVRDDLVALAFDVNDAGSFGVSASASASGSLTYDVWQHVAVTLNAGTVSFYRNGLLLTQQPGSGTLDQGAVQTSAALVLGGADGRTDRGFQGALDDLSVYNVALSGAEILTLYRASAGQPRHRLVMR